MIFKSALHFKLNLCRENRQKKLIKDRTNLRNYNDIKIENKINQNKVSNPEIELETKT